jgi:hypothetical protein
VHLLAEESNGEVQLNNLHNVESATDDGWNETTHSAGDLQSDDCGEMA